MKRLIAIIFLVVPTLAYATAPELPRVYIDTTYSVPGGDTIVVGDGENFQTAINNADCGDIITLNAGSTYTGNFTLPDKSCSDSTWIYIRTSNYAGLPAEGVRVAPGDASAMAKLTVGSGAVITSNSGADHYRFIGIEITPSAYVTAVIDLSGGQSNLTTQTNHIIFDRCYIHGHSTNGSRRGINANAAYIAVVDSYLSDFKEVGADTQAFAVWNGSGPFKLVNNYLEAAGENVMFGGGDSAGADFQAADIEIRRNLFSKPLTWKADDPSYLGVAWSVKNLFELKAAKRVWIENNRFEHNWLMAQAGTAIVFTPRGETSSTWHTVQDVTFRGNVLDGTCGGINILSEDGSAVSTAMARVSIQNNLFLDIDRTHWSGASGGDAFAFQHIGGDAASTDVVIDGNTVLKATADYLVLSLTGTADYADGFIFRGNIISHQDYGIYGDGKGTGDVGINWYMTNETVTANVLYGNAGASSSYTGHSGNYFPANLAAVEFVNAAGGNYRLDSGSDYYGIGTGGADLGVWFPSAVAAETQLDWSISYVGSGTSVNVTFGYPALGAGTSCTVRAGTNTVPSTSGAVERTVQVTGLTPDQQYAIMVDCGAEGGAISYDLYTATAASTGTATVGGGGSNTLAIGGGGSLTLTVSP